MNTTKLFLLFVLSTINIGIQAKQKSSKSDDRSYWVDLAWKMAQPVLENISKGNSKKTW